MDMIFMQFKRYWMTKAGELRLVGWICGSQRCQRKQMDGVGHLTLPREITLGG